MESAHKARDELGTIGIQNKVLNPSNNC